SGSHRTWARQLAHHSKHDVVTLELPGRHWQWRMHGGALALADEYAALSDTAFQDPGPPDVILASGMLDLAQFLGAAFGAVRPSGAFAGGSVASARPPVIAYFHENQFAYPVSPGVPLDERPRDLHYQYVNFSTARVADC